MSGVPGNILQFADRLWPGEFEGESWAAWRIVLKAVFGIALEDDEIETFNELTGRENGPTSAVSELWAICGRRGGKSRVAALVGLYLAVCRFYKLAIGERGVIPIIAADRRQARVIRRYIGGLIEASPTLQALVERQTREAIDFTNGLSIEIHTASYRTVRGYTVVAAICDEIAFWPNDESAADPDKEIIAALRPAMATVPDALLFCLSSPYARKGELFRAHERHHGKEDSPVLVVKADTRTMNPTVPQSVIDAAYEDDPQSAAAEYGAEFRTDVEAFLPPEVIEACVVRGRAELPPCNQHRYVAFLDFAGGTGTDSATLAIVHAERRDGAEVIVLDAVRETRPPFSPEQVCEEFANTLRLYRISEARADRYAGDWPREQMQKNGIRLQPAEKVKSDIYRDSLPILNSQTAELLDVQRLKAQLAGLERRTSRGGRDSIDHGPGRHDDLANAVCGALTMAALNRARTVRRLEYTLG